MASFIFIIFSSVLLAASSNAESHLFREYIGADSDTVKFTDVPINPNVEFHFILAFAIDYSHGQPQSPTNGDFSIFWGRHHLSPTDVASIKSTHPNVKVAVSLGGASVSSGSVHFKPKSISSWVSNAISSLTEIIKEFNLDGIDIDYENFSVDHDTFAECIGQLVMALKEQEVISFASIAPYEDVQGYYLALWRRYGHVIDYVNFQFYAYDVGISVAQFIEYFDTQVSNYAGGKILASITTDGKGGLGPEDGFFEACKQLKQKGKLGGIFVWSADDSKKFGFRYEEQAQELLA